MIIENNKVLAVVFFHKLFDLVFPVAEKENKVILFTSLNVIAGKFDCDISLGAVIFPPDVGLYIICFHISCFYKDTKQSPSPGDLSAAAAADTAPINKTTFAVVVFI